MADVEGRIKELEAKVRELTDREAIRELRFRYHEYINEGRFADLPNLFTEDCEADYAHLGKCKGKAELARFFGSVAAEPKPGQAAPPISFVKQFIHNHFVHLHGDQAHGYSFMEAKPVYKGESFLVAARFDDEYVKQNGEWKFKKISLKPYFMVPLREGWASSDRIKMGRP